MKKDRTFILVFTAGILCLLLVGSVYVISDNEFESEFKDAKYTPSFASTFDEYRQDNFNDYIKFVVKSRGTFIG